MTDILSINNQLWEKELDNIKEFYDRVGKRLPKQLLMQYDKIKKELI
jgi:GTP-dependent phosphoenolpyruvate carboxykinase